MRQIKNHELKELINNINESGLDASRMTYENFRYPVNLINYHPTKYNGNAKEFEGMQKISIGSQIYSVTPEEYDLVMNQEQTKLFDECISKEKESERFKSDLKSCFNCFTFEIVIYSPAYLKFMSGNWYKYIPTNKHLPLDATAERVEALKEEAEKEAQRIIDHMTKNGHEVKGYEIKKTFKDVHYIGDEWTEILNLCEKSTGIDPRQHPTHQSRRVERRHLTKDRLKEFKEVTLKTTGRKMLMNVHAYGWNFVETQPVIK